MLRWHSNDVGLIGKSAAGMTDRVPAGKQRKQSE